MVQEVCSNCTWVLSWICLPGRPPVLHGRPPLLHGRPPVLHGRPPVLHGRPPVLHGRPPVLHGRPPVLHGRPPVLHGRPPVLPHQVLHHQIVLVLASTVVSMQIDLFSLRLWFSKKWGLLITALAPLPVSPLSSVVKLICLGIASQHTPNTEHLLVVRK